jgi:hypothetical protein
MALYIDCVYIDIGTARLFVAMEKEARVTAPNINFHYQDLSFHP